MFEFGGNDVVIILFDVLVVDIVGILFWGVFVNNG